MAYKTEDLLKKALQEIEKKKLVFHEDVFGILGISSSTYYEHFPKDSKEYNLILIELTKNKVAIKAGIRNKWYKSKADQGGLYLYKLIGNTMERERLSYNHNKNENEHKGEINHNHTISADDLSTETLLALKKDYEDKNRGE